MNLGQISTVKEKHLISLRGKNSLESEGFFHLHGPNQLSSLSQLTFQMTSAKLAYPSQYLSNVIDSFEQVVLRPAEEMYEFSRQGCRQTLEPWCEFSASLSG